MTIFEKYRREVKQSFKNLRSNYRKSLRVDDESNQLILEQITYIEQSIYDFVDIVEESTWLKERQIILCYCFYMVSQATDMCILYLNNSFNSIHIVTRGFIEAYSLFKQMIKCESEEEEINFLNRAFFDSIMESKKILKMLEDTDISILEKLGEEYVNIHKSNKANKEAEIRKLIKSRFNDFYNKTDSIQDMVTNIKQTLPNKETISSRVLKALTDNSMTKIPVASVIYPDLCKNAHGDIITIMDRCLQGDNLIVNAFTPGVKNCFSLVTSCLQDMNFDINKFRKEKV